MASTLDRMYVANLKEIERYGPLKALVIGRTGAGKSSTVNTLLCSLVAKESEHVIGTRHVNQHVGRWRGLPVLVYDTPGFGDASKGPDKNARYLAEISSVREKADVVVFVSSLNEKRSDNVIDEMAMRLTVQEFGREALLASMVLVFTFSDKYEGAFNAWSHEVYRRFCRLADVDPIDSTIIPSIAIRNTGDPKYRIREADELWVRLIDRCERLKMLPLPRLCALRSDVRVRLNN